MKKYFLILIMCLLSLGLSAQENSIWNNNSIGLSWSHMDRDNYTDNNVEINIMIYGIYFDTGIGCNLRDYGYNNGKRSYCFDFGYEFPVYVNYQNNTKFLIGPILGYNAVGYDYDRYDGTYYYENYYGRGYYDSYSNGFHVVDDYFNYGVAMQFAIGNFAINGKISRSNIGIGIGYSF